VNLPHGRRGYASISFGFERHDGIWTYRLREGLRWASPSHDGGPGWFARQPDNLGVEAMAGNRQVSLLISEGLKTPDGQASALLFQAGDRRARPSRRAGRNRHSRARHPPPQRAGDDRPASLPDAAAELERGGGFQVELDALDLTADRASIHRLAEFKPPIVTDNFEGMAVRKEGGRVMLYIIADDNFEKKQRTLLLKFRLD
jgi:hypothetical protein